MKILTTLADGDFFLGFAALVNSAVTHGTYVDKVIVGYRGALPGWLPATESTGRGTICKLNSGLTVEFVELKENLHMVHEKPRWFKMLSAVLEPEAEEFFFFDSDIVVMKRMSFLGEWVQQGVAICEDVFADMGSTHPIRKQWETLATEAGLEVNNKLEKYHNSGFVGWSRSNVQFIEDWVTCFDVLSKKAGDIKKYRTNDRTHAVASANQDSFNLAAMITKEPISVMGPDAMDFQYGINIMSHAITGKPWRTNFFKAFLNGKPPRRSDLLFWQHVNGPALKPFSSSKVKYKIATLKFYKLLGRFYARN